jgi:two-component system, chemotaxis family, protein-glutamate methylesterase/glutaminase
MSMARAVSEVPLEVLVVDDSALVRQLMLGTLEQCGMKVKCAADPLFALERMRKWRPDVIVLDLEMPRMDGLTFLRVLAREHDIPVVICSGVAGERSVVALRALQEGAVEVVARPRFGLHQFFRDSQVLLNDAIIAAAQSRPRSTRRRRPGRSSAIRPPTRIHPQHQVIALGASTGGTEALREIITAFPPDAPATVVVQHMPEGFTAAFARSLDEHSRVRVKEAVSGDAVREGTVLIAPGGRHLRVRRDAEYYVAEVSDGPLVSRHRPSVDVLFESVARVVGRQAAGVLLTGMGEDGKNGMLALRNAGATTYAQDEATSMVFGMPKAAIEAGAVDEIVPIHQMARAILAPGLRRA